VSGIGAGLSQRTPRFVLDVVPRLCVYALLHGGGLFSGAVTRWQWPSVLATMHAEWAYIRIVVNGQDEQRIAVSWDPVYFGGQRPYLICPDCQRRYWNLYFHNLRFLCRRCHQLAYASRHQAIWHAGFAGSLATFERRRKRGGHK
jgi:hypothetical protein